jgi:hypothetical protein
VIHYIERKIGIDQGHFILAGKYKNIEIAKKGEGKSNCDI